MDLKNTMWQRVKGQRDEPGGTNDQGHHQKVEEARKEADVRKVMTLLTSTPELLESKSLCLNAQDAKLSYLSPPQRDGVGEVGGGGEQAYRYACRSCSFKYVKSHV